MTVKSGKQRILFWYFVHCMFGYRNAVKRTMQRYSSRKLTKLHIYIYIPVYRLLSTWDFETDIELF